MNQIRDKKAREVNMLGYADNVKVLRGGMDRWNKDQNAQSLVLPDEGDSGQAVPLAKVDRRWRVPGFDPHHGGFHFRRGAEVVLANLRMGEW